MGEFANRVGYFLMQPDKIIYAVATALLYPVLFTEVAAMLWMGFQTGVYTLEVIQRRRARKSLDVEEVATQIARAHAARDTARTSAALMLFDFGPIVSPVARTLAAHGVTRVRALKLLTDAEQSAVRRLDTTRIFIRIGPILGLMGTLIPISPALVGLAKGDTQTLSANLVVAFSTTVVGLLVGATAYLVSLARERMYTQDLSDLEYVLERSGV